MRQRKQLFSLVKHAARNIFKPQTLSQCGVGGNLKSKPEGTRIRDFAGSHALQKIAEIRYGKAFQRLVVLKLPVLHPQTIPFKQGLLGYAASTIPGLIPGYQHQQA